jgi:hypothetical protein
MLVVGITKRGRSRIGLGIGFFGHGGLSNNEMVTLPGEQILRLCKVIFGASCAVELTKVSVDKLFDIQIHHKLSARVSRLGFPHRIERSLGRINMLQH